MLAFAVFALLRLAQDERGGLGAGPSLEDAPGNAELGEPVEPELVGDAPIAPVSPANVAESLTASDDARRELPLGRRGRVATRTGDGVAGVELVVTFAGAERARTITGPDGTYAFADVAAARDGFLQPRKAGWSFKPWRVRLRAVADDAALDFVAERVEPIPFRARLVDERTGEPVPRLSARVRQEPGVNVIARSDDEGVLSIAEPLEPGRVEVEFLGGSYVDNVRRVDLEGPGAAGEDELVLQVDLGPTYELDLVWPDAATRDATALDDLEARLVPAPHPATRSLARALECDAPLGWLFDREMLGTESEAESTSLLADGPRHGGPWARFAQPLKDGLAPRELDGGFELCVAGAGLFGRAAVPNLIGVCPGVVRVALGPAGGVAGKLTYPRHARDRAELPVEMQGEIKAWRRLDPSPAMPLVELRDLAGDAFRTAVVGSDGGFEFLGLAPGEYELVASSARVGEVAARVVVPPGDPVSVELAMPVSPSSAFAIGVLTSRSGAYSGEVQVELVSRADPARRYRLSAVLGARRVQSRAAVIDGFGLGEGLSAALFVMRGIPPGSYELRPRSTDGLAWTPPFVLLDAPNHELVFTCEDEIEKAHVEVDVRDAETGDEVSGFDLRLWRDGDDRYLEDVPDCVARTARGGWVAFADGYRPARGTWAADPESDVVTIAPRLERGRGVLAVAMTPWRERLPGVKIVVDGESLGRTDADGTLLVDERSLATAPPARVEARLDGYTQVWANAFATIERKIGEVVVVLARD